VRCSRPERESISLSLALIFLRVCRFSVIVIMKKDEITTSNERLESILVLPIPDNERNLFNDTSKFSVRVKAGLQRARRNDIKREKYQFALNRLGPRSG
jgi:hypothetical protein